MTKNTDAPGATPEEGRLDAEPRSTGPSTAGADTTTEETDPDDEDEEDPPELLEPLPPELPEPLPPEPLSLPPTGNPPP